MFSLAVKSLPRFGSEAENLSYLFSLYYNQKSPMGRSAAPKGACPANIFDAINYTGKTAPA
jgi:hypothetical protein